MILIGKVALTDLIMVVTLFIASSIIVDRVGPKTLLEKVILIAFIVSLMTLPILAILAVWLT